MKKTNAFIAAALVTSMLTACGGTDTAEMTETSAETEESVTTVSEETTTSTSETKETTETTTSMSETEETTEETSQTTENNFEEKIFTADDGTELLVDRCANLEPASEYWSVEMPDYDTPYLIAYNNDGINVFGYLTDINKEDPSREYGFYTYITHGGTVDSLPGRGYDYKTGKYLNGQLIKDIDGDGTDEVISILPCSSGVACDISSLTIYDIGESGHYEEYLFPDPDFESEAFEELMNKNVSIEINEAAKEYTLTSLNSDAVYVGSTEIDEGTITSIKLTTMICGFDIDEDGKIYMSMLPVSEPFDWYDTVPSIISEVVFDGKVFSLKNTRFEAREN